jgi:hypothetical protein
MVPNKVPIMPLSRDKKARSNQLANVRPAPPAPKGNKRTMTHGGQAQHPRRQAQLEKQIAAALPVRDANGDPPAHDAIAVALLALTVARLESCARYVTQHGQIKRGKVSPAAQLEEQLTARAAKLAGELGLTPRSRVALGLTLKQTEHLDLATLLSDAPRKPKQPVIDATVVDDD